MKEINSEPNILVFDKTIFELENEIHSDLIDYIEWYTQGQHTTILGMILPHIDIKWKQIIPTLKK
jgi:hypothetical protein